MVETNNDKAPEQALTLRQKLNLETAKIAWHELQVSFARGNIVVVDADYDLIEVAEAISQDNNDLISQLIASGKVLRPDANWVKQNTTLDTTFWALVVIPFVIIQKLS